MPTLPRGSRLGVDIGTARIGIAASDPDGILAMPVATVPRGSADIETIAQLARERGVIVIYLGLPKHLSGAEGASSADARQFAQVIAAKLPDIELRFVDERLSTVSASGDLRAAGRKASSQKSVIDQQAAVIILQSALDFERSNGKRAGLPAEPIGSLGL
jgi:putative Holliday junction resolvase